MESIKKYVKDLMAAKEMAELYEENRIRFSVTIEGPDNNRLEYVAKKLDESRASLASDLILLGLSELEKELGLDPYDFKSEYANHLWGNDDTIPVKIEGSDSYMKVSKTEITEVLEQQKEGEK